MTAELRPDRDLAARAAAEAPAMELDPEAVLVAARRHVRRRTAWRVSGTAGGIAALVVAAVLVAGLRGPTIPAPAVHDSSSTQHAHSIGDGRLADVAMGLTAVNRPGATTIRQRYADYPEPTDGGTTWTALGLVVAGHEAALMVAPMADGSQSAGIDLPVGGAAWTWGTPQGTLDPGFVGASADGGTWFDSTSEDDGRLGVAVLPVALPDPRVLVWSVAGLVLADGSTSHAVEVPTFAASNGHLLSVWHATGTAADAFTADATGVVVVGSDGRVVVEPCEAPAGACPQLGAVPGLVQAVTALGGDVDGTSAPTAGGPVPTPSVDSQNDWSARDEDASAPAPVEVAAGVSAAVGPFTQATALSRDDPLAADLPDAWRADTHLTSLGSFGSTTVRLIRTGARDATYDLVLAAEGGGTGEVATARTPLSQPTTEASSNFDDFGPAIFDDGQEVEVGVTPAGTTRAFAYQTGEFVRPDGTQTHVVELPTFTLPAIPGDQLTAGRRWYAAVLEASALPLSGESGILFAKADGTVVDPSCTSSACVRAQEHQYPELATLLAQASPSWTGQGTDTHVSTNSHGGTIPKPATVAKGLVAGVGPYARTDSDGEAGTSTPLGSFQGRAFSLLRDGAANDAMIELGTGLESADAAETKAYLDGDRGVVLRWAFERASGGVITYGVTPTMARRVFYWSTLAISRPDGTRAHVVELPTFTLPDFRDNPVATDRRWFLIDDTRYRFDHREQVGGVLFTDTAGNVVDAACGAASCAGSAAAPYYAAAAELARGS